MTITPFNLPIHAFHSVVPRKQDLSFLIRENPLCIVALTHPVKSNFILTITLYDYLQADYETFIEYTQLIVTDNSNKTSPVLDCNHLNSPNPPVSYCRSVSKYFKLQCFEGLDFILALNFFSLHADPPFFLYNKYISL